MSAGREARGAILLDKDGVLVDFHRTWKPAIRRAALAVAEGDEALALTLLKVVGHDRRTDSFLPGSIWAAGTQEELFDAWHGLLPRMTREQIAAIVSAVLEAAVPEPVVPLPVLRDLMGKARAAGWKLAVVTNDLTGSAEKTARLHEIDHLLDAVIGSDLCERPKPHPDLVFRAADTLSLPPGRMVMVGDNVHDGEMARRAGCATFIGVLSGTSGHAELAPLAAHVVADVAAALELVLSMEKDERGPGATNGMSGPFARAGRRSVLE